MQGQSRGIDGFDRGNGVALNAGDLNQAAHGVAGHAKVVLHANFCGVFDLLGCAAHDSAQAGGGPLITRTARAARADAARAAIAASDACCSR